MSQWRALEVRHGVGTPGYLAGWNSLEWSIVSPEIKVLVDDRTET